MTKLVLKCGDIELEYDGPEDFLKTELPKLIEEVARFRMEPRKETSKGGGGSGALPPGSGETSVTTLARKLGVKTNGGLIVAAALSLMNGGAPTFSKKQLRARCKEATGYYKDSYYNNIDNELARLVKLGRVNRNAPDSYVIPDGEKTELEKKLKEVA